MPRSCGKGLEPCTSEDEMARRRGSGFRVLGGPWFCLKNPPPFQGLGF